MFFDFISDIFVLEINIWCLFGLGYVGFLIVWILEDELAIF